MEQSLINQKISKKAKERAKIKNPIVNIWKNSDWIKNNVEARKRTPKILFVHPQNRKVYKIKENEFRTQVQMHGVLKYAKLLNCSQNTVRERCYKLGIHLKEGPRPSLVQTIEYSKRMRRQRLTQKFPTKATSIEIRLWKELESRNIKFEKHKSILNLTQPDAFIEPNICIYADGDYWHNLKITKSQDQYVNKILKENGYRVYRFWEHEINQDVGSCLDKVLI